MAGGEVDPRQRCLKVEDWPEQDRLLWSAAEKRSGGFKTKSLAKRAVDSQDKFKAGYGRFLGFLAWSDRLEHSSDPAARITPDVADAFTDLMKEVGNADHTIVGRFEELQAAMKIFGTGRKLELVDQARRVVAA